MRTNLDNVVPNLMRHFFPTYRVPQMNYAEGYLPMRIPGCATCGDTTLSNGLAALGRLSWEQIVSHVEFINTLNGKSGLLRRVELCVDTRQERDALEEVIPRVKAGELQVEPVAVIQPHPSRVEPLQDLSLAEVGVLFGASDYLCVGEETGSRTDQYHALLDTLDACLDQGFKVRLDLLDITRSDLEVLVIPLVSDCMDHLAKRGYSGLRLRLVDSLGLGLPWPEAPVPRSIPRMVHTLTHNLSYEGDQLEFLGHNDMGLGLVNSLAAVMHGCTSIATSLAGVGERAGITPTELALVHLCGQYGIDLNMRGVGDGLGALADAGGEVAKRHPLWGELALKRGFPAHANAHIATFDLAAPFDTSRLIGRTPELEIRRENEAAGVIHLIHQVKPDAELECDDEAIQSLLTWIDEQGLSEITWDDIKGKAEELLPDLF